MHPFTNKFEKKWFWFFMALWGFIMLPLPCFYDTDYNPGFFGVPVFIWGWLVINQYIPAGQYLLASLSVIVMLLMLFVIIGTLRRWSVLLNIKTTTHDSYGVEVKAIVNE